ncbi:DIMBOA UDP-glucosyltransferase BX9-like [Panicum virgatum]|uniref:2,4-dihydroxy-7-methoxy-2H-1,4-benzoxazin-3(4H)-one 2-D-glucosyltransferase n=1 Tax=Panicum virgatum TaxID=38727 RepID=A0A8T0PN28_PANVG|nr:DIMBOA UDP-glucosyltransferase BX9-like [Panicum virgatum]KAG2562505.1 hypothetical protein PVAP13_8KG295102 [Panicum virgatum]
MASNSGGAGHRVVLFPFPYQGHLNPMLRLAAALHARGLAITVVHAEHHAPDPADHPADYRFVPLPADVPAGLLSSEDVARLLTELDAILAVPFGDRLAALLAEQDAGGVCCVIADVQWYSALAAARKLGVPTLGLMTSSAASFRTFMAYPTLIDKGYLPVQEGHKDDPVDELPPFRVRDLQCIDKSILAEFASLLERIVAEARRSCGLILNTFDAIEAADVDKIRQDLSIPVFTIGPLNKLSPSVRSSLPQDRGCLNWLDTQEPGSVLYVSFGSFVPIDADEFTELVWGLANSKSPFIWVVRRGLVRGFESGELPDGLEEEIRDRGRIVHWAPQEEVLAHPAICAFVTHNGWNSTVEAISGGVPMICRPLVGDQLGTARYVCNAWRVGVEVEVETRLEWGKLQLAIDKLMADNDEGKEVRERMKYLTNMAGNGVSEGGSSHTSFVNLVEFILSFTC